MTATRARSQQQYTHSPTCQPVYAPKQEAASAMASPPVHRLAVWLEAALLLSLCCRGREATQQQASPKVSAVIVFGDSTVDTGNNNVIDTVLKSNFPPYGRDMAGAKATGRFCNGRLPPDFISETLGLPPLVPAYLDPAYGIQDFAQGLCFASAGTGLDNATAAVLKVIPLWKEVEYFKEYQRRLRRYVGRARAKRIVSDALYVVSIGTNDLLENYFLFVTGRFAEFTVPEFEDFLVAQAEWFLTEIHRLGARRATFAGLTPIGCVPLERTLNMLRGGCIEEYNQVARDYNAKLQDMLRRLQATHPGFKVAYVNVYQTMLDLINNPGTLGLENVEEGCCATGRFEMSYLCNDVPKTCEDPDKYFFWDSFHPTQKVNSFFAKKTLDLCYQEGLL